MIRALAEHTPAARISGVRGLLDTLAVTMRAMLEAIVRIRGVAAPVRYSEAEGRVEGAIRCLRHAFFHGYALSGSAQDERAEEPTFKPART